MPLSSDAVREAGPLEASFARFLGLLDEPFGGLALHACYDPEAPLPFMHAIRAAASLEPKDYALHLAGAAAVHEAAATGVARQPMLGAPTLVALAAEGEGMRVAWFTVPERDSERLLNVAVGYRRRAADWKIGWLTLAATVQDWSFAKGRLQTVSDFGYLEGADLAMPRSWLDAAYLRLYGHPRPPLVTLPEARFSCHSSGRCCNIGFGVDVGSGAQAVIDAVDWASVRPQLVGATDLPVLPDGRLALKAKGENCRFLDDNKHCLIHREVGRAPFPVCNAYPFIFKPTPDGLVVTASATCSSVRGNLGPRYSERADDLYDRYAMVPVKASHVFCIAPDVETSWEAFRAAEATLLALLDRAELPLARRLLLGSHFLAACEAGTPMLVEAEIPDPTPSTEPLLRKTLEDLVQGLLLRLVPDREAPLLPGAPLLSEADLTHTLKNILFSKVHSFSFGLRVAHNVSVLLYMVVQYWQAVDAATPASEKMWRIVGQVAHGPLVTAMVGNPTWRDLLADPRFGPSLLSHPLASGRPA